MKSTTVCLQIQPTQLINEAREMKKDIIEFIWLFVGGAACFALLIEIAFRGAGI